MHLPSEVRPPSRGERCGVVVGSVGFGIKRPRFVPDLASSLGV